MLDELGSDVGIAELGEVVTEADDDVAELEGVMLEVDVDGPADVVVLARGTVTLT